MGFSCGIVGLPNVGKSSLFNVLSEGSAESSNYPFCTIEPNIGCVALPDRRLNALAQLLNPKKLVPTTVSFTDIAGLVKGAHEGEGLGNQFLSHIREVQAIIQVVRLFDEEDIVHIAEIDPIRDVEIILTELRLKDLDTLENRKKRIEKEARTGKRKDVVEELAFIKYLETLIEAGRNQYDRSLSAEEYEWARVYQLLSFKPMILVANMSEKDITNYHAHPGYQKLCTYAKGLSCDVIALSAKLEEEIVGLGEESVAYLKEMGIEETGLAQLIRKGYSLLNLITFFTAGEQECRAWSIEKGTTASQSAGKIHTDFEKGFIRAEVVTYEDFIQAQGSYSKVREQGKLRIEGRDYVVADGDIMHFRFNV